MNNICVFKLVAIIITNDTKLSFQPTDISFFFFGLLSHQDRLDQWCCWSCLVLILSSCVNQSSHWPPTPSAVFRHDIHNSLHQSCIMYLTDVPNNWSFLSLITSIIVLYLDTFCSPSVFVNFLSSWSSVSANNNILHMSLVSFYLQLSLFLVASSVLYGSSRICGITMWIPWEL